MVLYREALVGAMEMVANEKNSIFVGQAVRHPGTAMFDTLRWVPMEQRVEFPIAENFQLGYCIGRALGGSLPLCIYPRINFLLEAVSQLVQHLDKIPAYSEFLPKVIIRTAVPTPEPLDPGPQHLGDYSDMFKLVLKSVKVVVLDEAEQVMREYAAALERRESTLIVERTELYTS